MSRPETSVVEYSVEDALRGMVARAVREALVEFQPQAAKRLFNVRDAAEYLGRSEGAVRELERSDRLIAKRVANRVMFERDELNAFVDRETE